MSLTRDGVWKAGVWAPTVWASGVWYEAPPVCTTTSAVAGVAVAGCAIAGTGGTVSTDELRGGGGGILHIGRHRTKEELRAERERLGILPKPELVVEALKQPDPIEALEDGLEHEAIAYKAAYRQALLNELRRRDDEAIALILLLH